jgi:hypothetical protein
MGDYDTRRQDVERLREQAREQEAKAREAADRAERAAKAAAEADRVCSRLEKVKPPVPERAEEKYRSAWDSKEKALGDAGDARADARTHRDRADRLSEEVRRLESREREGGDKSLFRRAPRDARTEEDRTEKERARAEVEQRERLAEKSAQSESLADAGQIAKDALEARRDARAGDARSVATSAEIRQPANPVADVSRVQSAHLADAYNSTAFAIAASAVYRILSDRLKEKDG